MGEALRSGPTPFTPALEKGDPLFSGRKRMGVLMWISSTRSEWLVTNRATTACRGGTTENTHSQRNRRSQQIRGRNSRLSASFAEKPSRCHSCRTWGSAAPSPERDFYRPKPNGPFPASRHGASRAARSQGLKVDAGAERLCSGQPAGA